MKRGNGIKYSKMLEVVRSQRGAVEATIRGTTLRVLIELSQADKALPPAEFEAALDEAERLACAQLKAQFKRWRGM